MTLRLRNADKILAYNSGPGTVEPRSFVLPSQTSEVVMTVEVRSLPRTLAAIAAELEMDEATYVTVDQIRAIAARHGISSQPRDIAWRLRQHGWLLPTESQGVWEFAPASHAGPYGRGDVFAVLNGNLARRPDRDLRVALISALWLHGWAERPPSKHEVTAAPGSQVSAGLTRTYRILRFDPHLPPVKHKNTPAEAPATILAHIAARPSHISSWEAVRLALPELADASTPEQLRDEMAGRPVAVGARLGYLLHGAAPDLVRDAGLEPARGVTRFGSGPTRRFNSHWNVADTMLPFDPADIGAAG
jgi:predicted transcriptional regulator of viral defense system